jgi:hypothetical protein
LFASQNIIRVVKSRRMKWMEDGWDEKCKTLVGRLEGKRSLEKPRRRWEDNIRMDLREIG